MSDLIRPLQIGSLRLETNLLQGPLAGYSCAAMRKLVWQFGGVGYCATEMLSAYSLSQKQRQPARYVFKDPSEGPLCFQISGDHAEHIARATARVCSLGADMVDLNCGCPQPKIRKKGHGSRLLSQPERLYQLLKAMKSNASVPVSVKIRVDGDSGERFNTEVAQAVEAAGVDLLIVHGRHWRERYDVDCRPDQIKTLVDQVNIPVIANGDVDSWSSLKRMMASTGAAGVMISRAGLGRPWLFAQIQAESQAKPFQAPLLPERKALLLAHVKALITLDNEHLALLQLRKLWKYYGMPVPDWPWTELATYAQLEQRLAVIN